jgi:hypothetical protein
MLDNHLGNHHEQQAPDKTDQSGGQGEFFPDEMDIIGMDEKTVSQNECGEHRDENPAFFHASTPKPSRLLKNVNLICG